jgi:hypothetical protein
MKNEERVSWLREEFLKEVARIIRQCEGYARDAVRPEAELIAYENPDAIRRLAGILREADAIDAFVYAVRESLETYAHSLLVAIDGGTALAEKGLIDLVDEEGNSRGDGLHEEMFGFLDDE